MGSGFVGLLILPCTRCNARTGQLTLLVQLFNPKRWVGVFTLCISCLQVSQYKEQYALNSLRQTVYRAREGAIPASELESVVLGYLNAKGLGKAGSIQWELGANGVKLNDHETDELLRRMEFKGLVVRDEINQTENVIKLLQAKSAPRKECPVCGDGNVWSLYAQMRGSINQKESKKVIGSFCPSCRSYQLDAKGLIERFVFRGKEAI